MRSWDSVTGCGPQRPELSLWSIPLGAQIVRQAEMALPLFFSPARTLQVAICNLNSQGTPSHQTFKIVVGIDFVLLKIII